MRNKTNLESIDQIIDPYNNNFHRIYKVTLYVIIMSKQGVAQIKEKNAQMIINNLKSTAKLSSKASVMFHTKNSKMTLMCVKNEFYYNLEIWTPEGDLEDEKMGHPIHPDDLIEHLVEWVKGSDLCSTKAFENKILEYLGEFGTSSLDDIVVIFYPDHKPARKTTRVKTEDQKKRELKNREEKKKVDEITHLLNNLIKKKLIKQLPLADKEDVPRYKLVKPEKTKIKSEPIITVKPDSDGDSDSE